MVECLIIVLTPPLKGVLVGLACRSILRQKRTQKQVGLVLCSVQFASLPVTRLLTLLFNDLE